MLRSRAAIALFAGLLACPSALAACDTSKAPSVPVIKGLPYKDARQALLTGGWQPTAGHPHNDMSSNESTFRDRGYGELQFCRLTSDSPCRFQLVQSGFALWITTAGEENTTMGTQATVRAVKLACQGAPDPG